MRLFTGRQDHRWRSVPPAQALPLEADVACIAACSDGTLHLWSTSSNFARPNATVEKAHTKDTHTSCVVFSADGKLLVSRGGDDTVKRALHAHYFRLVCSG